MINWLTGEFQLAHFSMVGAIERGAFSLRKKLGVRTCATVRWDLECKATRLDDLSNLAAV
jgi:hypothetical protein